MGLKYSSVLLLFVLVSFCFVTVSAQNIDQSSINIILNKPITVIQVCSSSTYSNITTAFIDGQNNQLITTSTPMSLLTTDTYSYQFNNTNQSGIYYFYGICNEDGIDKSWGLSYVVSPAGRSFTSSDVAIYIFFLLVCGVLVFFSTKLLINNPISKDPITNSKLYEIKKRNEFLYLLTVLKTKMYIIGLFGIYLSILLFTTFLNNLVYNLDLVELNTILSNLNLVLLWGLVPFIVGWIVYLIITFYRTTVDVMRYQFGNIVNPRGERR